MFDFDCPPYSKLGSLPADVDDDSAIVTALAFSPHGDKLAMSSMSESATYARVYSISDLTLRWTHSLHKVEASCMIWHPTSKAIIIGNQEGDVQSASLNTSEANDPRMNWGGGEIRGFAVSGNLLAVGCETCVSVMEMGSHRSSTWQNRKDMTFPGEASATDEPDLKPAGIAFTKHGSFLVVTYETEGIVIYDPATTEAIHRIVSIEYCCSSALSPLGDKLFVVNQVEGLDIYHLSGQRVTHESSVSLGTGSVNMFIPIVFVHGGAGVLIGSTTGVVRILSAAPGSKRGATLQTYRADGGTKAIQEIVSLPSSSVLLKRFMTMLEGYAYSLQTRRHYLAFGSVDDDRKNTVALYTSEEQHSQVRRWARSTGKVLGSSSYVLLAMLLVIWICLGILTFVQLCLGGISLGTLIRAGVGGTSLSERAIRERTLRGRSEHSSRREQHWLA